MRIHARRVRRSIALLTVLVALGTPAVFGDDTNPNEPPEARIKPPIGVSQQVARLFDLAGDWIGLYARLMPLIR